MRVFLSAVLCFSFVLLTGCRSMPEEKAAPWQITSEDQVTILLPAPGEDKLLDGHLRRAAEMLKTALFHRTGARASVMTEGKDVPVGKIISLGNTRALTEAGLSTAALRPFDALIAVQGGKLFIAGIDRRSPTFPLKSPDPADHRAFILSSSRGAVVFAEKFLDTRFLLPEEPGTDYAEKASDLELPGDLHLLSAAAFQYMPSRNFLGFYNLANQDCGAGLFKTTGGHSYYDSVPRSQYAKDHPEYFAELAGRRDPRANHLCISNPDVQKLLGDYLIAQLDKGAAVVELGQTDGYKPCECVKCKALYGVDDPGEKLWILHRDIAARVLKERPEGKVMIISYGPTVNPPQTFREFPANTMIELCGTTPENLEAWKKYVVPCGFTAYLYYWGIYNVFGFTPRRSVNYVAEGLEQLRKLPLHGIYRCGFGELFGLEGPVYYIFGKLVEDSTRNPKLLFDEFISRAYHESAAPMRSFFELLDERLQLYRDSRESDPKIRLAACWPPNVLARLETSLSQAERAARSPEVKARLQLVRYEFDYLSNLAGIFHLYAAYESCRTQAVFDELCKKIDARNALIDSRMTPRGAGRTIPGWGKRMSFFDFENRAVVTANGTLRATVGAPLNWDTALLRKYKVLPGAKLPELHIARIKEKPALGFEQGVWRDLAPHEMGGLQLQTLRDTARFKAAYDDEALYILFSAPVTPGRKFIDFRHDGPVWGQDSAEIFVDPDAAGRRYFHFIAGPGTPSMYEAAQGLITDVLHPRYNLPDGSWNGKWSKEARITDGVMEILMKIPFATLGTAVPSKGTVWRGNLTRSRFFEEGFEAQPELSSWAPNFENMSFENPQAFGKLVFE